MSCRCQGIRRAAVSGLFALWLAPLPPLQGGLAGGGAAACAKGAPCIASRGSDHRERRRGWAEAERRQDGRTDADDPAADRADPPHGG